MRRLVWFCFFFFKQKTAYELRISDWSSDVCSSDLPLSLIDPPGTYSLTPASLDEAVTRDVVLGRQAGETRPDALIVVLDAANLDNHLNFALELLALNLPTVVALNMVDLATRDGLTLDADRLSKELGVPVVPTVAVGKRGLTELQIGRAHV